MAPRDAGREYVEQMRTEGYTDAEIRDTLREGGWSEEQIRQAMAGEKDVPPPPPPEEAPPARKASGNGRAVWVIVLIGCLGVIVFAGAMMAAIMFPVFAAAREKARQTTCLANLKQIGLAHQMYARDHEDTLPPASQWPDQLLPYLLEDTYLAEAAYECPSDITRPATWKGLVVGYTMNAEVGGVSVLRLQSPAATPLCYDGAALAGGMDDAAFRHNGGANCAYVDGHVGWVYEGQWGDQWRTPPSAPAPDAPSPPAPAPPPVPPAPPAPQSDATSRLNARARAQASACQSNLKQVSLAMLMYTQDWDETLPPTRGWPERLYPYTRNHQLLVCPSDRDPHRSEPGDRALSYTMNAALDRRSLLNVARPAEEIGLFDGSAPVGGSDAASFRHAGHLVAGWVDGHVRMIPEDEWETWWRPAEEDGPHSADRAR